MVNDDCDLLPWDSEHFGFRVARVRAPRLTAESLARVDDWCGQNSVRCLYFSCAPGDRETIRVAEAGAFHLVDVRTTFVRTLPASGDQAPAPACRRATAGDLDWIVALARSSFGDSRFYFDGGFDRASCDLLYEKWARRSMADTSQAVWLALADRQPAGFVACQCDEATRIGSIGLIAVDPQFQGRGVGADLVACAAAYFGRQGMSGVKVVTQGRNPRALRLYERCGFSIDDIRLTYHKWYPAPDRHA